MSTVRGTPEDNEGATSRASFYAGFSALSESERKRKVAKALQGLEEELEKIPDEDKKAYLIALAKIPKEAKAKKRKVAFLEREYMNSKCAAERLVKYWDGRLHLFGKDRCFLPMTLHGALQDQVKGILNNSVHQLLPNPDSKGRRIIYSDLLDKPKRDEAIVLWYLLEMLVEDLSRPNGAVLISNVCATADNSKLSTSNSKCMSKIMSHTFEDIFPLWFSQVHSCSSDDYLPSPSFNYDYLLNKESQKNIQHHVGTPASILKSLEAESLTRELLPTTIDGNVYVQPQDWIYERLSKEYAAIAKAEDRKNKSSKKQKAARKRAADEMIGGAIFAGGPNPNLALLDADASSLIRKTGRKSDERMIKATLAKLRNPLLSRRDALLIGGYVYEEDEKNKKPTSQIFDSEGVSLYQRMNHLNRRVKQMREKLAEAKPKKEGGATPV